jgi:hypothetical protein
MSLLPETQPTRPARSRKNRHIQPDWTALDTPLGMLHSDQILLFHECCRPNRFSPRTGRRIIPRGEGPVATRVSPKRIGITVANNSKWQRLRERA